MFQYSYWKFSCWWKKQTFDRYFASVWCCRHHQIFFRCFRGILSKASSVSSAHLVVVLAARVLLGIAIEFFRAVISPFRALRECNYWPPLLAFITGRSDLVCQKWIIKITMRYKAGRFIILWVLTRGWDRWLRSSIKFCWPCETFHQFFVWTKILPCPWPMALVEGYSPGYAIKYPCICNEININPIVISDFKSYQLTIQHRATLILMLKSTNEINIITSMSIDTTGSSKYALSSRIA